jgi:thiol-disulfide isomerase/thioredoxin
MIDFYTDWCKSGKKLVKEVYASEEFLPFTKRMTYVAIDAEKGIGIDLKKKYNIQS